MNQLTTIQPQTLPAFTMSDMERVALAIAKGGLFGSTDPNAVLTLCMLAQAEGQHPAVVFRDYHIISGKPAKKAEAMQRDFLAAGGKIEWHKLTDDECEATFSHPLGGTATINWDKARVKQAQLGGNKMHEKYPRQMLRSRVISEGVRTVFPSATSGLYESGEVQDMAPERAEVPLTPQPQRARDMKPAKAEPAQIEHKPEVADKVADGVRALLERIRNADPTTLVEIAAEPAVVKQCAWLAKNRPELAAEIDRALAGDPFEGPSEEQRGEAHSGADDDFGGEG